MVIGGDISWAPSVKARERFSHHEIEVYFSKEEREVLPKLKESI